MPAATRVPPLQTNRSLRSTVIRQVTLWHWVSSGITLGGMLLFTITGITLNHANAISAKPVVRTVDAIAPGNVIATAGESQQYTEGRHPLPRGMYAWLSREFGVAGDGIGEWSANEIYVSLPRPGGDAWITIDRASGKAHYEETDRGWISYLNDLHKGRHTGRSWSVYIDLLAVACLVFTFTGLILLQTHAPKRPATWPLVAFSVVSPILVLMFFVHR